MAMQMGIWRVDGKALAAVEASVVGLEQDLENYIESDPTILGQPLLMIGRQVQTTGGPLDLLAIDSTGVVHVIELKREKTPREATAQVLDYGSWVAGLSYDELLEIFSRHRPGVEFDQAFEELFGAAPPEDINEEQIFTIVATGLDPTTERIVRFLNDSYGVPINAVLFQHFRDSESSYLARTWLVEQEVQSASAAKQRRSREPWNGRDWGVTFGTSSDSRSWEDAAKYGFVSAGGGRWYSQTLRNLPINARVFVNVPGAGYVGIGTVIGKAERFDEATLDVEGQEWRLADLPLTGTYRHEGDESDALAEWVVPIEWEATRPQSEAFWVKGMRANQNSAFRLYQQFTIEKVTSELGLGA